MGYTLMATRADPQPIGVLYTVTKPFGEPPDRRFAYAGCSGTVYDEIHPDDCLSRPAALQVLYTLRSPLGQPPEKWRLAHAGCLSPAYDGTTP